MIDYHTVLESIGIAETAGAPFVIWVIKEWVKLRRENKDLKERVLKFELKEELRGEK